MEKSGIKRYFDGADTRQTPAAILGKLVVWFVFIIAITMATDAFGTRQVSAVSSQLTAYIPNIIAAVLILVLAGLVRGATGIDVLGTVAQAAIMVYAIFAALTQRGIAVRLTAPTFLIVLGAVAVTIAFGRGHQTAGPFGVPPFCGRASPAGCSPPQSPSGPAGHNARLRYSPARGREWQRTGSAATWIGPWNS